MRGWAVYCVVGLGNVCYVRVVHRVVGWCNVC